MEATNLVPATLTVGEPSTVTVEVANRTGAPSRVTASVRAPAGWRVHKTTQRNPGVLDRASRGARGTSARSDRDGGAHAGRQNPAQVTSIPAAAGIGIIVQGSRCVAWPFMTSDSRCLRRPARQAGTRWGRSAEGSARGLTGMR